MTTPSKCLFCRRHFSAYIDGEIAPHLRADMDSHLATCPACRKELQDLETMLGTLTVGKAPDPSRDLDRAIMRRITLHIPSNGMPSFRSIPIYAAVTGLLIGIFLAKGMIGQTPQNTLASGDGIIQAMDIFSPSPRGSVSSAYFAMMDTRGQN